jgi:hypothetical protein
MAAKENKFLSVKKLIKLLLFNQRLISAQNTKKHITGTLLKYCIYQYIYSFNVESVHFKQTHENK